LNLFFAQSDVLLTESLRYKYADKLNGVLLMSDQKQNKEAVIKFPVTIHVKPFFIYACL